MLDPSPELDLNNRGARFISRWAMQVREGTYGTVPVPPISVDNVTRKWPSEPIEQAIERARARYHEQLVPFVAETVTIDRVQAAPGPAVVSHEVCVMPA